MSEKMMTTRDPAAPVALSQVDAARALGVSVRTLHRWDRRGLIRGNRVAGGVRLYPVDELRRLARGA